MCYFIVLLCVCHFVVRVLFCCVIACLCYFIVVFIVCVLFYCVLLLFFLLWFVEEFTLEPAPFLKFGDADVNVKNLEEFFWDLSI